MSNLAHKSNYTGEVVQFPTKERQSMSNKEEGFTPLPNFICDEGYLSVLDGEALKCLVFLNRHIEGFHIEQKALGEALVMKITGIKDKRTVRKYMAELERYQLISIQKENGKSHVYSITFENRLPVKPVTSHDTGITQKPVASHVPSESKAGTCHVTTPVASHVPATSDMACHPVKEIDFKENIKESVVENSAAPEDPQPEQNSVEHTLKIWNPNLDSLNSWLQRSGLPKISQGQVEEILLEVNPHYENKIHTGVVSDTQMYSNFVKWVKRDYKLTEKLMQQAASANTQPVNPQNLQADMGDW